MLVTAMAAYFRSNFPAAGSGSIDISHIDSISGAGETARRVVKRLQDGQSVLCCCLNT